MHVLKALAAQVIALLMVIGLVRINALPLWISTHSLALACLQGLCAACLAYWLGCARWWLLIHVLFMPALVLTLWLNLPPWIYLIGLIGLILVYWNSFRSQVPLFLSNHQTVEHCVAWLPNDKPLRVLDVGSGTGSFACQLATLRPDWQVTGIESAPIPYWLSRWLGRAQKNLQLFHGNFWQQRMNHYDVVYAFLSPVPMPTLWKKLQNEMRPESLLISNSFSVVGEEPEAVIEVNDRRKTKLYCYRIHSKC